MYNVSRNVQCGMVLYMDLNCILRIYSATQGYNVVLCCIIIKVAVEGCILLLKGGGKGHIGVCFQRVYSTM